MPGVVLSSSLEISQDFGPVPAAKGGSGNMDIKLQVAGDSANVDWEKVCRSFLGRRSVFSSNLYEDGLKSLD